jgi:hypothetical protein
MITPEAVLALRAYTSLSATVQGTLQRRTRGFDLSGDLARDGAPRAASEVYCTRRATFHRSLQDAGESRDGTFRFHGRAFGDERLVLTGMMRDEPVLVSFDRADVVRCSAEDELSFGTLSAAGPLVPALDYAQPVLQGPLQRALFVSAAGCLLLSRVAPGDAAPLYDNLRSLDIVVEAQPREANAVLYRIAGNAVLAAPHGYEDRLAELQAALRVAPSAHARARLPAASALQISGSMADPAALGQPLQLQQLRDALPPDLVASLQPLTDWQLPAKRLSVRVVAQPAQQRLSLKPWLMDEVGVQLYVSCPAFAPPRPGVTLLAQKEQLATALRQLIQAPGDSRAALDAAAAALASAAAASLNATGLFAQRLAPAVSLELIVTRGQSVRLPSGAHAVVPDYACHAASVRMTALTAPLVAVGMRAQFTPWPSARQGLPV